jgi:arylsulfatase A-like enzyme
MNADMDKSVGQVLQKIKTLGIEEHTVVFFTSDNGGLPQSPQTPLRGFKGMYYEGGIRVPMFVRWTGKIPAGSTSDTPVINVDLYPTFLQLAGATRPDDKLLDGESLVGLVTEAKPLKRKAIFWHFPGYLDRANAGARDSEFRTRPVTVIRKGNWKLHLFHEEWSLDGGLDRVATNQSVELYDLSMDMGEQRNLADAASDKRDELISDLLSWSNTVAAKFAQEPNPEYGTPIKEKRKRRKKKKEKTNP